MDSQHKRLIHPVNQMDTILRDKEGHEALNTVLAEMSGYAGQHFHDEEDLLLKHAYPSIADQQTGQGPQMRALCHFQIKMRPRRQASSDETVPTSTAGAAQRSRQ